MCGIVGLTHLNGSSVSESLLSNMIKPLNHRGPDSIGLWSGNGTGFAHARLSIHDLTNTGHQPMFAASKEWLIVFNGEIYNYEDLKQQLLKEKNIDFRGDSDTEVLVNAVEIWGIEKTLKRCIGMFAFGVLHIKTGTLYLARDRFGEKPLYFSKQNNIFAFASELKALKPLKSCGWQFTIDRNALATYMRFGYVPTPYSIYQGISKLEVGCYLEISNKGIERYSQYWQPEDALKVAPFVGDYTEAVELLETKLKDTLHLQMASDVPLGAFLSGGVDSSTIVALMQKLSTDKINTFSIGFSEKMFDESEYARQVANCIGTNHTELYVEENHALNIISKLPRIYDEPFADSSQIPTYLVSELAKSKVSVSLSGDGGDELFGGYNHYFLAQKVKSTFLDNRFLGHGLKALPSWVLQMLSKTSRGYSQLLDKLMKLQNIVRYANGSEMDLYRLICSQIYNNNLVIDGLEYSMFKEKGLLDIKSLSFQEWMMFADSQTYMIDDILTKVDRAAMAVSLETRVPFLDQRLYEFAWSLPINYKIKNGIGKCILRDVLYRYVPKELIERPKMGFGVPMAKWLRNDLKEWAEYLLDYTKISNQGFLNPKLVHQYWQEHIVGKRNWQVPLWTILMFQAWLEKENIG